MKEREIFVEALEHEAGRERDAFLARCCAGDDALRSGVERLLLEHSRQGSSLLDSPILPGTERSLTEEPGQFIGRYQLLQVSGEGGFGTVWMAEQREPVRRKVALKILKAGLDTKQVIARFEAERQALALMDHPNIARVFDGGATQAGRPYFVMEFVKGVSITEYCDAARMGMAARLKLFRDVCHAVQHAHNKGVIHRDIKPSNVLVADGEGGPTAKVIDFGIAKATSSDLTQRTLFTEFRQILGTPEYMAPEQARSGGVDIDTRADVYSLGVLLYELLTGTKPFDLKRALESGWDEMLRVIREQEPPRPSTRVSTMGDEMPPIAAARHETRRSLGRLFRDDLDWIVLKALEKDRDRRYDTASGFAEDIGRFLGREAVLASPPSKLYRLKKLASRNRKTFVVASVVVVALFLGITGTTYGMLRARSAEEVAANERDEASRQARIARATVDFLNDDLLASADPSTSRGHDVTVREVLDNAARTVESGLAEDAELEASIRATLGRTYLSLGAYDEAVRHLQRTAELEVGVGHELEALRARSLLAEIARLEGSYERALTEIEEALVASYRLLGDRHRDTLRARLVRGRVLTDLARYEEAETSILVLLDDAREALGEDDRVVLSVRASLGHLNQLQGRYEEAEATQRDLLRRRRALLGEDHPDTLRSLGAVASLLWQRSRHDEAEELFREQLAIRSRVLGEEHPLTLASMYAVASLLSRQNEYEASEALFREILVLQERVLGPDAPDTLVSRHNLAVALDRQGRNAEALELYRGLAERYRELLGQDHPQTLLARNNVGMMLHRLGRSEEAEVILRETMESRREVLGREHPRTMQSVRALLTLLRDEGGRDERVRSLQVEYLAYLERTAANPEEGFANSDLLAWELLIAIPVDLRDPARALELIEEVLRGEEGRKPQYLDTYAKALFLNGDVARAIEIEREAIESAPARSTLRIEFRKRMAEYEAAAEKR